MQRALWNTKPNMAPPQIPLSDLSAKRRSTRKGSVPNPVFGDLGDPFYQLFCKAQNVLSFFQSQRPAGATASKEHNDLFAMLWPIETYGGHRTHPGMVLINSGGWLNSLYPFMPEIS